MSNTQPNLSAYHADEISFYPGYKGYYDGALRGHNNPINLAIKEQDEYFKRQRKQVDFAVSFGTGLVTDGTERTNIFSNLWISKLYESFMGLMDGQNTWRTYYNAIPEQHRARYHRLNMEFDGAEPQLDDLSCLTEITQKAANPPPLICQQVRDIADNMLSTLFYIGLDSAVLKAGQWVFCARVLCRLPPGRSLDALVTKLKANAATFSMNAKSQPHLIADRTVFLCVGSSSTRTQQPFSCPIEFFASSKDHFVDIKFNLNEKYDGRERSISNCPYKVEDLMEDAGMHQIFGRADHKTQATKRKLGYSRVVNVAKRRKLKLAPV